MAGEAPHVRAISVSRLRSARQVFVATLAGVAAVPVLAQTTPSPGDLAQQIVFDENSPLAANSVLIQRLLSPRSRQRELENLAAKNEAMAPYPLSSAAERFSVYLPTQRPAKGYGLLVFIPPWQDARLPLGWAHVLDRAGIIFVSAERSGNEENIVGRRIPLALTAAYDILRHYPIDIERVFIGGFSGGSRVALRTAIAYPDVFSGELLNAGSDPIGEPEVPLPSPSLMKLLQTRSRFAFVTGDDDDVNLAKDAEARSSLARFCITQTWTVQRPHMGHEVMDSVGLAQALAAFSQTASVDPAHVSSCQTKLDTALKRARSDAMSLQAQPPSTKVDRELDRLDRTYGALLEDEPAK